MSLTPLIPRPTPRGVLYVENDNFVPLNRVENFVPKAPDVGPTDAGHVGFLRGVGVVEQASDRSIDAIGKGGGDRRSVFDEIRNALFELERRRLGVAYLYVRGERAFLKIAATCSSLANLPSRMAASPRSIPFRSSSLKR